jgi:hypothetical protein
MNIKQNTIEPYQILLDQYKQETSEYLAQYKRFINQYREEYDSFVLQNIKEIESNFQEFLDNYKTLYKEKEESDSKNTPDFSIFNIVDPEKYRPEERIHSPFLFDLLNTQGSHKQKAIFYELFIRNLLKDKADNFINENPTDYYIKLEEPVKTLENNRGRIDIFIKSTKKRFAIIIENKWNSPDSSENQIFKYYDAKHGYYKREELLLIYLTKFGGEPAKLNEEKKLKLNELKTNSTFYGISYKDEISNWLTDCIKLCESEKVNLIIEQYLRILKNM